jgi:NAD+ synthase (glutamine-hydrolysing)
MAVGYSTLYGDMAGGFDVLKDVGKMQVYALAAYRNKAGKVPVIPQRVIDRPPSAELAPGQVDEDNLPPYAVLDRILELYVEQDQSVEAIVAQGFERSVVEKVVLLVDRNEYKRRQAPIGVRITQRGFGRDRRYPITSGWKPGD